jgi:hypothetical protein
MITPTTLKNAAFAIEHDLFTDPDGCNYLVKDGAILRRWEPETSSADSFELMVRLRLDINYFPGFGEVHASDEGGHNCWMSGYTGDLAYDTRRAILLCAEVIGESLKCQS